MSETKPGEPLTPAHQAWVDFDRRAQDRAARDDQRYRTDVDARIEHMAEWFEKNPEALDEPDLGYRRQVRQAKGEAERWKELSGRRQAHADAAKQAGNEQLEELWTLAATDADKMQALYEKRARVLQATEGVPADPRQAALAAQWSRAKEIALARREAARDVEAELKAVRDAGEVLEPPRTVEADPVAPPSVDPQGFFSVIERIAPAVPELAREPELKGKRHAPDGVVRESGPPGKRRAPAQNPVENGIPDAPETHVHEAPSGRHHAPVEVTPKQDEPNVGYDR